MLRRRRFAGRALAWGVGALAFASLVGLASPRPPLVSAAPAASTCAVNLLGGCVLGGHTAQATSSPAPSLLGVAGTSCGASLAGNCLLAPSPPSPSPAPSTTPVCLPGQLACVGDQSCPAQVSGQCVVAGSTPSPSPGGGQSSSSSGRTPGATPRGTSATTPDSTPSVGVGALGTLSGPFGPGGPSASSPSPVPLAIPASTVVQPLGPIPGLSFAHTPVVVSLFAVLDVMALVGLVWVLRRSRGNPAAG